MCGGQRSTCWRCFSPSGRSDPGIKLRILDLMTGPVTRFFMVKFKNKDKKKNPKAASEKAGHKNKNQLSVRFFFVPAAAPSVRA